MVSARAPKLLSIHCREVGFVWGECLDRVGVVLGTTGSVRPFGGMPWYSWYGNMNLCFSLGFVLVLGIVVVGAMISGVVEPTASMIWLSTALTAFRYPSCSSFSRLKMFLFFETYSDNNLTLFCFILSNQQQNIMDACV